MALPAVPAPADALRSCINIILNIIDLLHTNINIANITIHSHKFTSNIIILLECVIGECGHNFSLLFFA